MKHALFAAALVLAACDEEVISSPIAVGDRASPHTLAPANLPAFFDCLREQGATVVSAHRGRLSPAWPENAIMSFRSALAQIPVLLEVDVSRTRDGVLVLMHDDTVNRTTDGEGAVGDMTAAEFTALSFENNAGRIANAHPPTLRQALDWAAGRAILELDVKRGVSYEDVASEVRDANAMDRVVFITYSVDGASRLARVAPEAMIYTTITGTRDLDTLERRGVDLSRIVAWLGDDELDVDLMQALDARGVEARYGMFGRGEDFAGAARAGLEGVAVNDVEAAYGAIDAADGEAGYAALQCLA